MITNQNGVSVICGALDHWYREKNAEETEFKLTEDWRLLDLLNVDHVRRPPDYRDPEYGQEEDYNTRLTVPAFRFPRWHTCPKCNRMKKSTLSTRSRVYCDHCEGDGRRKGVELYQVRFVAACDHGHIQDFPWDEWTHESLDPDCDSQLKMRAFGGGSLGSIRVRCEKCGENRSLSRITVSHPERNTTHLTDNLSEEGDYRCRGLCPWTGTEEPSDCGRPVRGSLRNATNLYFGETVSSLYLPPSDDEGVMELVEKLRQPKFSLISSLLEGDPEKVEEVIPQVRETGDETFRDFSDDELAEALRLTVSGEEESEEEEPETPDAESGSDYEDGAQYRRAEFDTLQHERTGKRLTIRDMEVADYREGFDECFSETTLVDRLQETRVLTGFTRLNPGGDEEVDTGHKRRLLWKSQPYPFDEHGWLPATVVHGEGIFLNFSEDTLQAWEGRNDVRERVADLQSRYEQSRHFERNPERTISPRFVLVHTFTHLLMNRLVFECGYSTAALRERLYVSDDPEAPMAGVLIYTAAGDSDGTMGGLVRMGQPNYLEPVILKALTEAQWCSADPICMEAAERGGQGPEGLNLAACHNCALVPETSCEEFNHFLDRGLLIGFGDEQGSGYFESLLAEATATSA